MAAHLVSLPRCDAPGCNAPATQMLRNTVNAEQGRYCTRHGKAALRQFQNRYEERER